MPRMVSPQRHPTREWRGIVGAEANMPDKGKDERGVGYVKGNAIAGRDFASWTALEAYLARWMS